LIWNLRFRAMGTRAHLLVEGEPESLPPACRRIERLERLWSRFIADSEVSRLNRAGGTAVPVSPETAELLRRAEEGWRMTGGLFDPTLLNELIAAGYDRDFDEVREHGGGPAQATRRPAGGDYPVTLDDAGSTASIAAEAGFDSGGVGKGLAADMVAESLASDGAARALVNLGGDLRAIAGPDRKPWKVDVDNPFDRAGPAALTLEIANRGLATTTSLVRRWRQGGEERHHLIDPRTGRPAESPLASVTVIAAHGWQAEVLAKAAFLSPPADALQLLADNAATGLLIDSEGRIHLAPGIEPHLTLPPRALDNVSLKDRALGAKTKIRLPR